MKLSFLAGAAVGYVLGARAGRARYESIVRAFHTVTGSQTVQSSAGVFQAQGEDLLGRVRSQVGARLPGGHTSVR
ncbi:MAG: hypothetical protein ABJA87_01930 [bacterium]